MADEFAEDIVPQLCEDLKLPEGTVRGLCAAFTPQTMRDRALQWELALHYGVPFEAIQLLLGFQLSDLQAIGRGAASSGVAAMAISQKLLIRELSTGTPDPDTARAWSSISKQQSDLARAWIPQDPQQHQHLHAHLDIPAIAALMERKKEKPMAEQAREALRAQGREV